MLATLSKMGFRPSFLHWVRLFYTGVQSCVNVNGYLSPFFVLSRGVRQGCPLSPLLYMQVSEVLAVNIRANPRITGLSILGSRTPISPISQYADDTSLIVNFSYWVSVHFHTTIASVLANPSDFHSGLLSPFYRALLSAWREVEGSVISTLLLSCRCFIFPS